MILEVIGGYVSNSIAIMTDAAHLLSDLMGFLVSIFVLKLSQKGVNKYYTFGYHRAETIGALGSISIIWFLTLALLWEAVFRLIKPPEEFNPLVMMLTAFIGILVNILMGLTLHRSSQVHLHSHDLFGGHSHDHDHGHSHGGCGASKGDYIEMVDLKEVDHQGKPLRSKSLDLRCVMNYEIRKTHHHHKNEEENLVDCCEVENCKDEPTFQSEAFVHEKKPVANGHAHTGACDHDHDDGHDHDHPKAAQSAEQHHHEHNGQPCQGHAHDHEHHDDHKHDEHGHDHGASKVVAVPEKKHDHAHDHKHDHGKGECGGHDHGHNHDHKHDHQDNHDHNGRSGSGSWSLFANDEQNVNIRAAYIHIIVVIYCKPEWLWFDPLCTIMFSIIVFVTTIPISKDCIHILMEGAPAKLDAYHLRMQIEHVPDVIGVYELRIWSLNEGRNALSAKVLAKNYSSSLMREIKGICKDYGILQTTIELQLYNPIQEA